MTGNLKYGTDYTWKKRDVPNSISAIVGDRIHMEKDKLLNDNTDYRINHLDEAVDLFVKHSQKGSTITAYCDYDTDGIDAALILSVLSEAAGIPVQIYVPKRFSDGYGIRERHVERFLSSNLLILCDNGIAANEAVALAKEKGMDVIILDHHEPRKDENDNIWLPDADVIVDPHVTALEGEFTEYCGAGLTYRFAKEVLRKLGVSPDIMKQSIDKMAAFAAIGTVGDVVELSGENRRIVKEGIQSMLSGKTTSGLKCLLDSLYLDEYMDVGNIGFGISPVFNANGRINDSGSASVFSTISYDGETDDDFKEEIDGLIQANKKRKKLSVEGYTRALAYIQETGQEDAPFLVVFDEECGSGIAGLVAGCLTSEFRRPSIVLGATADPELIKGSGRSPEYANLKKILDENRTLTAGYGGHPGACGITLYKKDLDAFRRAVCACTPKPPAEFLSDDIFYDLECTEDGIKMLAKAILKYGPYGSGNPEIVVRIDGVRLLKNYTDKLFLLMGDKGQHIKFRSKNFEIIWFDGTQKWNDLGCPETVSVLGTIGLHVWKGRSSIRMQAIDLIST